MTVEELPDGKAPRLRILVVGATNARAADLISGLDDEDDVQFIDWRPTAGEPALQSANIDVIVLSAHDATSPTIESARYRDLVSVGVPTIALCNGSAEHFVEWLGTEVGDVDRAPIPRRLLVARIERIRREGAMRAPAVSARPSVIRFGPIRMDPAAHEISVNGVPLQLTPTEYRLLELLMRHAGECLSRDTILDGVWGIDFDTGTNLVDMYIYFVRKRLKERGLTGVVRTVRGSGYRFVSPEEQ